MSSSTSDEMSDSSNSGVSQTYSLVPQITAGLNDLSCSKNFLKLENKPYLEITEQPQSHFRFRYISELDGTHGFLLGRSSISSVNSSTKTYPTVELVNFAGEAEIKCSMAQVDNTEKHPHKLTIDEHDQDVTKKVPEDGSYTVAFRGIGIVQTKKSATRKQKNKPKIDFNIVRLKFSAYDFHTGKEICPPVFSEPVNSLKSAATNNLSIRRISRTSGRAAGSDEVFIFVEKVNKNNINIRFFEIDETGKRTWEKFAKFMPHDVHHQYGIAFMTPPYINPKTPDDVTVYMELLRSKDGRTSDPIQFKYKADDLHKQIKRRKTASSQTFKSNSNLTYPLKTEPLQTNSSQILSTTTFNHQVTPLEGDISEVPIVGSMVSFNAQLYASSPSHCDIISGMSMEESNSPASNPMLTHNTNILYPEMADLQTTSNDMETMQYIDNNTFSDELNDFLTKFLKFHDPLNGATVVPDSGRGSHTNFKADTEDDQVIRYQMDTEGTIIKTNKDIEKIEYNAFYKVEDGVEVKKLVKQLCGVIRDKKGFKKQDVRDRLIMLLDKRLSNGDTFLHMSLFSDRKCLEFLVKLIHSVKVTNLLDYSNDELQTTLHLAVLYNMPDIVTLLVTKGANPMLKDHRDLNAVHYAVKCESCLEPLLDAVKDNNVPCNLNEYNGDKQTALHMAVVEGSAYSARVLLRHGASWSARDECGRTPLHLAAYDTRHRVLAALLQHVPEIDIDVTDSSGNTTLQIVCGTATGGSASTMARLLLEKKANPLKTENGRLSSWHLVKKKPELKSVLSNYVATEFKNENLDGDDIFLSADEGIDIDVTDSSGNTTLQIVCGTATGGSASTMARLLLEKKANPLKTENGRLSAWHLVKKKPELKSVLSNYVATEFKNENLDGDDIFLSADEGESQDHSSQDSEKEDFEEFDDTSDL